MLNWWEGFPWPKIGGRRRKNSKSFPDSQLRALACHKTVFFFLSSALYCLFLAASLKHAHTSACLSCPITSSRPPPTAPQTETGSVYERGGSCPYRKERKSFVLDYFLSYQHTHTHTDNYTNMQSKRWGLIGGGVNYTDTHMLMTLLHIHCYTVGVDSIHVWFMWSDKDSNHIQLHKTHTA